MPFIIDINEAGTTTEVEETPGNLTWPDAKAIELARLNQEAEKAHGSWWTYQAVQVTPDTCKIAVFDENDEYLGDL